MRVTQDMLQKMRDEGKKIAVLTCYDASFAALLDKAGVDILLVGDSLGNVLQGEESTLPVTLDDMIYHTRCVARGSKTAFIMTDMPFGTSQVSPEDTFGNAAELMAAGANMVKIEGGAVMAETVEFLTRRGIPVCAHIGLTPQSVNQLGGYKVQGKSALGPGRRSSPPGSSGGNGLELFPKPILVGRGLLPSPDLLRGTWETGKSHGSAGALALPFLKKLI